jgi:uncharacterized protein (TIGR03000 family)
MRLSLRARWLEMFLLAAFVATGAASADDCAKPRAAAPDDLPSALRVKPAVALRQCAGVYFSAAHSAWFEVDCLVPIEAAVVGVFASAEVPLAGKVRLWITRVYEQPKTSPPAGAAQQAPTTDDTATKASTDPDALDQVVPSAEVQAPGEASTTVRDAARIHLRLPSGARLTVEGHPVASLPMERDVLVRGLEKGRTYEYHVVAEVVRDEQLHTIERTISFAAGDNVLLDLVAEPELAGGN